MSSLMGDGENALFQLMSGHAPLIALLRDGANGIKHDVPETILQDPLTDSTPTFDEEDFPLITYYGISSLDTGPSFGQVTVEVNIFVARSGSNGGSAKLDAIDGVLGELVRGDSGNGAGRGAVFTYATRRVAVLATNSRGFPGADPLQRARLVRLGF